MRTKPDLLSLLSDRITQNSENAAMAVANVLNSIADMFRSMDNEYMQARAADAEDCVIRSCQTFLI